MQEFHDIDMTEIIPQNFITLAVSMKSLNESEIRAKYPKEIANKMNFESPQAFARWFKNLDGKSPNYYRNKNS